MKIMKKVINVILIAVGLTVGNVAYAGGDVNLMIKENQTLVVNLDDVEEGDLLFFTNKDGEILFKDSLLLKDSYSTSLDLGIIPRGIYYLHLEKENHIEVSVIEKTEEGIVIKGDLKKIVFKPQFKEKGKLITVFLTNPEKSATHLEIRDAKGTLVGSARNSRYNFSRIVDFSGVPAGDYIILVRNGNRTFKKVVKF